jgi:hypothetical protein
MFGDIEAGSRRMHAKQNWKPDPTGCMMRP